MEKDQVTPTGDESFQQVQGLLRQLEEHISRLEDKAIVLRQELAHGKQSEEAAWIDHVKQLRKALGLPEDGPRFGDTLVDVAKEHTTRIAGLESQLAALRDMRDPTSGLFKRLVRTLGYFTCQHLNSTRGGNDYIECTKCGLEWDYRKIDGHQAALQEAKKLLEELSALTTAPSKESNEQRSTSV